MRNNGGSNSVLITGAAGFGGSNITRALLDAGYCVTALDVVPPSHAPLLSAELKRPGLRYVWKSVQDIQPDDIEGHSVVVHMAAQPDTPLAFDSPRYTISQNVDGTVALLEALRRVTCVSRVVFAGSGNEIGRPHYLPIDEEHPLTPHNPYGFSKAAAELAMWAWHRAYDVPVVVMATGVVIGPHMRREVFIFKWLWNALHGEPIVVEGGKQTRDITYIDDVVESWMSAIRAPESSVVGQKFFVCSGKERTVEDLALICRDAVGVDVPLHYEGYRPGEEGQREAFTNRKAQEKLGYRPKVSAEEAIDLTAQWVKSLHR